MNLSKHSWLYRYAYCLTPNHDKPHYKYNTGTVDLCRFFWRCVLLQPLKLGGIGTVATIAIWGLFIAPIERLGWVGFFLFPSIAVAVSLFVWVGTTILEWSDHHAVPSLHAVVPDLVMAYYKAIKGKYCPLISISKE